MCFFCEFGGSGDWNALDLASGVLIPLLAAVIVAGVAWQGLKQVDKHRTDDRRTEAALALTSYLYREVELASTSQLYARRAFLRFSNGDNLIRAYGLLGGDDVYIGRWVADQHKLIADEVEKSIGEILESEKGGGSGKVGDHRAHAAKLAADTAETLMKWLRGDLTTEWFEGQVGRR